MYGQCCQPACSACTGSLLPLLTQPSPTPLLLPPHPAGVVALSRAAAAAGGKDAGRGKRGDSSAKQGMPSDSAKDAYLRRLKQAQR